MSILFLNIKYHDNDNCIITMISIRRIVVWFLQRFAPAASAVNNALYVTGGYDGREYLRSA